MRKNVCYSNYFHKWLQQKRNYTKHPSTFFVASRTSYLIPFTDVIHDILFSDDPTAQHTLSNITSQNCCLSKYHLCERYALQCVDLFYNAWMFIERYELHFHCTWYPIGLSKAQTTHYVCVCVCLYTYLEILHVYWLYLRHSYNPILC